MHYLKRAQKTPQSRSNEIRASVETLLTDLQQRGEEAVFELAERFDGWKGEVLLAGDQKARLIERVPARVRDDLRFAYDQVHGFATAQRESLVEFQRETMPGVTLGQRILPVEVAGCYVPGGRFAHACSALMSVATAKAAGVPFVVACSPPRGQCIAPAVAYALDLAGADVILQLGGVQAIAAMAYGLFTGRPAHLLVGPGNAYVAEAKALLAATGVCGIDVFAGPTESAVIADRSADPRTVAVDLVSQAEHGPDSPVWLFTDCEALARDVATRMPTVIGTLPNPEAAEAAWRDYGEIVVCADREEVARVSDSYAAEHVQVIADDLDFWLKRLTAYGSLFLGEGSTVPHGDKCSGTNHILPTRRSAYFSGGLNVFKFLRVCTHQRISRAANETMSAVGSRLSRLEGMEGHARACDLRLRKYFPERRWDFEVYDPDRRG